jgi:hypothetical protein
MKYLSFQCYIDCNSEYFIHGLLFTDLRATNKKIFHFQEEKEEKEVKREKKRKERKEIKIFKKTIIHSFSFILKCKHS